MCVCGCAAGALQVTISRISGICIGVGVSLLLSIIVYPSSASVKAMACLRQVCYSFTLILTHINDAVQMNSTVSKVSHPVISPIMLKQL